ncbi:MAG: PHP domain-containing protein [Euryarchaeota archaeon]|nr:PHP domain-containing protein [Euryarchaeota archaeon]
MRLDLHVHTKYSPDCREEPEAVLRAARARGLDGVAITDHNTIKGGIEAVGLAGDELEVIVGCEVMTGKGEVIGYFLTEEIRAGDYFEVLDEIRAQGGIACIPHPFDYIRYSSSLMPSDEMLKAAGRVEVLNARCLMDRFNRRALETAERLGLTGTAGSDAHTAREVGDAGVEVASLEDLRKGNGVRVFGGRTGMLRLLGSKLRRMG